MAGSNAQAIRYEYTYTGNTMYYDWERSIVPTYGEDPSPRRAYSGVMVIEEDELDGGTLVNADITFEAFFVYDLNDRSAIGHATGYNS